MQVRPPLLRGGRRLKASYIYIRSLKKPRGGVEAYIYIYGRAGGARERKGTLQLCKFSFTYALYAGSQCSMSNNYTGTILSHGERLDRTRW